MRYVAILLSFFLLGASKPSDKDIIEKIVEQNLRLPCDTIFAGLEFEMNTLEMLQSDHEECLEAVKHSSGKLSSIVCVLIHNHSEYVAILAVNLAEAYKRKCYSTPAKLKEYRF